ARFLRDRGARDAQMDREGKGRRRTINMVDLDFQRYIERRKGAREAATREGAAYAYPGDLRVLRTLDRLRPVRLAIEATVRMWKSVARAELLGTAVKVSPAQFPPI